MQLLKYLRHLNMLSIQVLNPPGCHLQAVYFNVSSKVVQHQLGMVS